MADQLGFNQGFQPANQIIQSSLINSLFPKIRTQDSIADYNYSVETPLNPVCDGIMKQYIYIFYTLLF